jgi:hypothetical protein
MAILLPVSTLAGQNTPAGGTILSPSWLVTINGDLVKNSTTLLGNESIGTGPESTANIASPGSDALLAANTVATYTKDSIELKSGSVVITTSNGMFAQVGKLKFAPANKSVLTKFEVKRDGCEVTVIARNNKVSLPDGKVLDQGRSSTTTDTDGDCCAVARPAAHHVRRAHSPATEASLTKAKNAPAGGAIITPSGQVTINSDAVMASSTLLGNETISTGSGSAAHITSSGSDTLVTAGTVITYSRDSIELKSGTVVITTNNGMFAQVGKLKFAPEDQGTLTKFEVRKNGCDVTVIARSNKVSLPQGKVLDQDRHDNFTDGDCCAAAPLDAHHVPYALYGLIGGGAAAAAAGVALLTRGSSGTVTAVSPSHP